MNTAKANELPVQWLKLMRYNKTIFGYKSEVDYPKYFLAKDGQSNPQSEMNASIEKFATPFSQYKDINQHPACLMPGRYLYLDRIGKIKKKIDINKCKDFKVFKEKLELNSVSVIFSSYYINKPASAFGHTFLKLNKEDPMTSDLNSYGVDFSAKVTTKNPIAYGVMGILGGFYGQFSLLPYFLKLREYNDFESRDLWEFELNFEREDLDLFVAHLWDMNLALFDYYYFTENCSYHVQRFVDAIRPDWNLWQEMYDITIPIDTLIPLVEKSGVTKGIYFRPSLYKRTQMQLNELNQSQKKIVKDSIDDLKLKELNDLTESEKIMTLDSIIDFIDYKFPQKMHLATTNNEIKDFKREVLGARSQLSQSSIKINKIKRQDFNHAHDSRKFRFGYRNGNQSGYEFKHRFALHNILEPQGDIYSNFSLEMGKTSLFYNQELQKFIFEEFEVAHVEALRPLNYLEKRISWNFNFGLRNRYEITAPYLNVGIGPSLQFQNHNFSLFAQSENDHPFNERRYQQSLLGLNFQWIFRYKKFAMKANYKKFKELVFGVNNIEIITSDLSYALDKSSQLAISTTRLNNDSTTSALISFYY